jgi:hypothetical protein
MEAHTMDEINDATGFANGERFASEAQVREYFTPANQRDMFGHEAETDPAALEAMAETVIANRWHMLDDAPATCPECGGELEGRGRQMTEGRDMETTISAMAEMVSVALLEAPTERFGCGGDCLSEYEVAIRIGEWSATVGGWVICGWVQPGAHADLDGSGLALWGNSQPGGWSWCHGGGGASGRPRVDDSYARDVGEPIYIPGGEGMADAEISPDDVPAWRSAIERDDPDEAERIRVELAEAIQAGIDAALEDMDGPAEPDVDEVFENADVIESYAGDLDGVRLDLAEYQGAGIVLLLESPRCSRDYIWWPTGRATDDAIERLGYAVGLRDTILRDIERAERD